MQIIKYRTELNQEKQNILVREKAYKYPEETMQSPGGIAEMLNRLFRLNRQAEEYVYLIAMDMKCHPTGLFEISHGTVGSSLCNPREVYIRALLSGACGIVLAHNHPSGDVTPSSEDIKNVKRMRKAGKLIGIELLDNLIIGDGYFSFRENKM